MGHIYIPGTINIEADKQSRALEDAAEWKLFLIKLLKNLKNQTYISLLLELISNWIDMCLGIKKPEAMDISALSLTKIKKTVNSNQTIATIVHITPQQLIPLIFKKIICFF